MVGVANSRSARTALPREQNHPGRRLEHAAHPTGDCRLIGFWRTCETSTCCSSAMRCPVRRRRSAIDRSQLSDLGEGCIQWKTLRAQMDGNSAPSVQELAYFRCDQAHVYQ